MSDFAKDLFSHAVQTTRDYAKVAVENYRAGQRAALSHVYVLWGDLGSSPGYGQSILGIFRTERGAVDALALVPDTIRARVERRMIGE